MQTCIYMCLLVSSLLFLVHPFKLDKLFTPTNLYIRYHYTTSHTLCLLGLIPKGKTNPMSLGTKTQGRDQPHTPTLKCLPRGLQGLSPKDPRSHINNISNDNAYSITQTLLTNQFSEYHHPVIIPYPSCNATTH